jgi:hypothetical protein
MRVLYALYFHFLYVALGYPLKVASCAYDKYIVIIVHDHFHKHTMKLYDASLTLVKQLELNYIPIRLTTDGKHIFTLSHHHAPYLYSYTMDFEYMETKIKLANTLNCEIYVRSKKLYVRDSFHWSFCVYDIDSGDLTNNINLPMAESLIDIDTACHIVLVNKTQKKLLVMNDTFGDVLLEKSLPNMPNCHLLAITHNGSIVMHDHFVESFYIL